jgi:hypothetical protein
LGQRVWRRELHEEQDGRPALACRGVNGALLRARQSAYDGRDEQRTVDHRVALLPFSAQTSSVSPRRRA